MEAEDSPFNKVRKQVYSFLDREMSITLIVWIITFLITAVLKVFDFIH